MVAPDRVLSVGQIELNSVFMLNWIVWNRTVYMYKDRFGGAHGIMVIVVRNGHSDTSSNPGCNWLHFT